MPFHFTPRERSLAIATALLAALALLAPGFAQPLNYHAFADQRTLAAVPHAMDVLSNLPFAMFSIAGYVLLALALRVKSIKFSSAGLLALFFGGLLVTAWVSAAYHWQPDDAGLAWDRAGMVLAFAGLLGLAGVQAVSARAGVALAALMLLAGPASIYGWALTGNLLPWGVVQFGGMGLIVWFAFASDAAHTAKHPLPIRWGVVIALYAVAKVLELADHHVWELTGHIVSGHSLKHVVASLAAWPVLAALRAAQCQRMPTRTAR